MPTTTKRYIAFALTLSVATCGPPPHRLTEYAEVMKLDDQGHPTPVQQSDQKQNEAALRVASACMLEAHAATQNMEDASSPAYTANVRLALMMCFRAKGYQIQWVMR